MPDDLSAPRLRPIELAPSYCPLGLVSLRRCNSAGRNAAAIITVRIVRMAPANIRALTSLLATLINMLPISSANETIVAEATATAIYRRLR